MWEELAGTDAELDFIRKRYIPGAFSIGGIIGSLIFAVLESWLGPRRSIFLAAWVYILATCYCYVAETAILAVLICHSLLGMAVGCIWPIAALYQVHCVLPRYRARVVAWFQVSIALGILLSAAREKLPGDALGLGSRPWMAFAASEWACVVMLMVGMCVLPRSPRSHVKGGHDAKAGKTMARILGRGLSAAQVNNKVGKLRHELDLSAGWWQQWRNMLAESGIGRRILRVVAIGAMYRLLGDMLFFQASISFQSEDRTAAQDTMLVLAGANLAFTVVGVARIEHFNRLRALFWSAVLTTATNVICLCIAGACLKTQSCGSIWMRSTLLITSVVHMALCAVAWGALAWLVVLETPDLKHGARFMTLAMAGY